ncbi:MAG: RNA-binding S4 domain-containing protein [bacterium]|nr:RNA-binding S4 domain-containing protein [bacterium]MDT8395648.1 RNA-binding S4 domain-containing protein [bacterium]
MTDSTPDRLRMDLFLKRSRLVKRRPLAATLCDNGYVSLNGREAQPGKPVRVGDRIEVRYARKKVLVEVTGIPGKAGKKDEEYCRVLREEEIEE